MLDAPLPVSVCSFENLNDANDYYFFQQIKLINEQNKILLFLQADEPLRGVVLVCDVVGFDNVSGSGFISLDLCCFSFFVGVS